MNLRKPIFIFFIILFISLLSASLCMVNADSVNHKKPRYINGVYRIPIAKQNGKKVWIVDGLLIRRKIYPEFLYGGNAERYPFVPKNEIWIDNAISAEEFKYTLAHELNERNLMASKGMSYANAHDSSLALEHIMRLADLELSEEHEKILSKVSPTDCDGIKQITELPDSIFLKKIYRQNIGTRDSISIWIVDGAAVRRDIYPDFGLSGNDLACHFIPSKEIWIDGQISCEETEFSITCELKEREFMEQGMKYDDAYIKALKTVATQRKTARLLSQKHQPLYIPKILERDIGTGSEKNLP